jgi:trk system potassium uptake protein TrkH
MIDTRSLPVRLLLFIRHWRPLPLLLLGYLSCSLIGWLLLSLPLCWQDKPLAALDNLFIAVSAVSTTGLVSISPGDSYNRFGEFVLMALIQLGGIGYMTIGSFAILATHHRFTRFRDRVTHAVFTLPEEGIGARQLITQIVLFTLLIESLGAAALYVIFRNAGMAEPLWSAVFHSI